MLVAKPPQNPVVSKRQAGKNCSSELWKLFDELLLSPLSLRAGKDSGSVRGLGRLNRGFEFLSVIALITTVLA